jgi:hypothetical protein
MVRRRCLIVQLALVGLLALLAFPGESSALRPTFTISLTPTGPSPAVLSVPASLGQVWFSNTDTVTHTVVFADASCSLQVAPVTRSLCTSDDFWDYVGDYAYTVDGTSQAQVVVEPVRRSVSLTARTHAVSRGSQLRLHGRLREENSNWSPPSAGAPQPITVLARPDPHHAYHRIAVVRATLHPRTKNAPFGELLWQLRVRPRARTTYIAEANYQPEAGQVWRVARSSPFTVRVRRN